MSSNFKGILFGIVAAVAYGLNPLFALPLYGEGVGTDSVLFFRYGFAAASLLVLTKAQRTPLLPSRSQFLPLAMLGLTMAGSSLFLFLSYRHLDVGVASSILFVYPVMVALIMAVGFKERLSKATVASLGGALAGIALLYRGGDKPLDGMGVTLVLASALSYAVYMVAVRVSKASTLPSQVLTFWSVLLGLPVFVLRIALWEGLQLPRDLLGWGCALGSALICTVLSLVATAAGIRLAGASKTAILGAMEPVTAVVVGVAVFHERMGIRAATGVLLIVGAVTLLCLNRDGGDAADKRA